MKEAWKNVSLADALVRNMSMNNKNRKNRMNFMR
jgi:hypothetical protein